MSVTVIAGILIAICGMYLSLAERSFPGKSEPGKEPADGTSPARFVIPRSTIYQAVTFVGLAILGISQASVPKLLMRSVLADGMRGTVFYLGACLTLAGAVGVVFSSTARSVVLSAAILGTGGATVLGVSGNAIVGGILLAGAALCGWWLHASSRHPAGTTAQPHDEPTGQCSAVEQALSRDSQPVAEPLLTSVAVVLFCWVLTSTIQSAVHEGAGSTTTMTGFSRALPRPAFAATKDSNHQLRSDNPAARNSVVSQRENALFWCAAGLLAATIGLGYSGSANERTNT